MSDQIGFHSINSTEKEILDVVNNPEKFTQAKVEYYSYIGWLLDKEVTRDLAIKKWGLGREAYGGEFNPAAIVWLKEIKDEVVDGLLYYIGAKKYVEKLNCDLPNKD